MLNKLKSLIKKPYFFPIFIFFSGLAVFVGVAIANLKYPKLFADSQEEEKDKPELFLGNVKGDKVMDIGEEEKVSPTPTTVQIPTVAKKVTPTVTTIPTNTPTQTPSPTSNPTSVPTETPSPTPTPTQTLTPTPSETISPTP
ncbi:MAG: hypothetical protein UT08_C0009G0030 [Candidatus Woesebacteria bacterium GW2011_GWB1_38_8]|uniref:Uncharacterized protein n=1 Tax=Candidatus Woesebacteria bacterium GW2011_GWB1_38_8 TaxID=1618570 RepID=A0A0G0P7D3_9BACT|nr:MAG: hypothetical protein UT08_C0009G0030 [Candidatus Woesebacteria bacterium GW2011_GWB1_38_8]KKS77775.1 MAG: hypothetical protein UV51_C0005G0185 [Candidatus Woesebacteria bacterium GW2011_GWC1_42_9]